MVKVSESTVVVPDARDTTETRAIAAKSLIAAALFAGCVLATTHRLCKLEGADKWKFPNNAATDGTREGCEVMKEMCGDKPFLCVGPFQQINMGDTTQLICDGTKGRDKPRSRVMHKEHFQGNRRRAPSKAPKTIPVGGAKAQSQPQNDPVNPQQVKVPHVSNAFGSCAEPAINFLGLSDDELPLSICPSRFASAQVEGLLEGKTVLLNFMRKGAIRGEEARCAALRSGPLR